MWAAIILAAISLGGVAFMLRFLLALHQESTQSTRAIISVPPQRHSEGCEHLGEHHSGEGADNFEDPDYYVELLESDIHAKQSSGLVSLTIPPKIGSVDWRPKSPERIDIAPHRRFFS